MKKLAEASSSVSALRHRIAMIRLSVRVELYRAHNDRIEALHSAASKIATIVILLLACADLTACTAVRRGATYQVYIDPAFTAEESADMLSAMDDWSANVPVHFSPVVGHCDGTHTGMICTHRATTAPESATTHTEETIDGAEIVFPVDNIPASILQGVMAHELGHAMGLVHEPGCLMAPDLTGWSPRVTAKDVTQWNAVRL